MVALASPSLQQACGAFQPRRVLLMETKCCAQTAHAVADILNSPVASSADRHLEGRTHGPRCRRHLSSGYRWLSRGCLQKLVNEVVREVVRKVFHDEVCPPLSVRRLSDSLSAGLTASLSAGQHKRSASQLDSAARQSSSTTQLDRAACPARLCPRQAWPRAKAREPGCARPAERTVVEGAADRLHCAATDSSRSPAVSVGVVHGSHSMVSDSA